MVFFFPGRRRRFFSSVEFEGAGFEREREIERGDRKGGERGAWSVGKNRDEKKQGKRRGHARKKKKEKKRGKAPSSSLTGSDLGAARRVRQREDQRPLLVPGQLPQHGLRERASLSRQADERVRPDVPDDLDQVRHVGRAVAAREGDLVMRQGVPARRRDEALRVDHEDGGPGLLYGDPAPGVVGDRGRDRLRDSHRGGAGAVKDDARLRGRRPLRADAVEEARADDRARALDVVVEAQLFFFFWRGGGGRVIWRGTKREKEKR